ncbi:MAG: hypothetical protein ACRDOE_07890 [Streptosporangiaceae bacterium]
MALCYGKAGELTGADREDQEVTMLTLHLLQATLVYIFSEQSRRG